MISVILPAYNEEENIKQTLDEVYEFFTARGYDFEIIVVNDGSTDSTGKIVQDWISSKQEVHMITHDKNKGYGAALKSGFSAARGDLIFFMDSDGQFDVNDFDRLYTRLDGYDGILGYRIKRADPISRIIAAWGWNMLAKVFLGVPYKDIDCAFKIFKRHVIADMPIQSNGAGVNMEIIARSRGYKFVQVGVKHRQRTRGKATGLKLKVVLNGLKEFWRIYRAQRGRQHAFELRSDRSK